ncbi:tetratricopeptide repeat protein [Sphingomonas hankookensis]|uniref:tetratricopeptide repeat protein n=1 Tax=Sphingomonas hankookensis TaxID=563996 RepID=UPI001F55D739|nr:tetratricopeptide repeat protein [Sphingomonas hankookensis]
MTPVPAGRFDRLTALLSHDPANPHLLSDTADAAQAEARWDAVDELLDRLAAVQPLSPTQLHLAGLAALQRQDWAAAERRFAGLIDDGIAPPPVRFNRAWALAMAGRAQEAVDLLDADTVAALPQAAQLRVQMLHDIGAMDEAMAQGQDSLAHFPDHRGLNAAVAILATDMDDLPLARACAQAAGDHPDALVTLGTLALDDADPATAARCFADALHCNPDAPRALVGSGLARIAAGGDLTAAATEIDRGAERFATHPGSWIAAGWTHFLRGDHATARTRFDTALALDDSFAEAHGALGVLDLLAGDAAAARQRLTVATRLDRDCFAAALGHMLGATAVGDAARAQAILDTALHAPIDDAGRTLADAMVRAACQR